MKPSKLYLRACVAFKTCAVGDVIQRQKVDKRLEYSKQKMLDRFHDNAQLSMLRISTAVLNGRVKGL